jgi:hypothetical protein
MANGLKVKNKTIRQSNRSAINDIRNKTRENIKSARQDMMTKTATTPDREGRQALINQFRDDKKAMIQDRRSQVQNIRQNPNQAYMDRMNTMVSAQKERMATNPPQRVGTPAPTMGAAPAGGTMGTMKKGGSVKKMKKGGSTSSCSKRADGCATKGKTKGRMI